VVQDIVTAAAALSGNTGSLFGFLGRILERRVVCQAATVAAISSDMTPALIRIGACPTRIEVTRNWPLRPTTEMDVSTARSRAGYAPGDFICLHAGNMGAKQGLQVVVEAARLAEAQNLNVRFVLMGDGNQRTMLQAMARGLTHVEFRPVQTPERYDTALAGADVLLITQRQSVGEMALPSKLTSYFGVGKPIVASVGKDSITAAELYRSGSAHIVPAGDAEALLSAVLAMRSEPAMARRLGDCAKHYYKTELNPIVLRMRFVDVIERADQKAVRRITNLE
jgi:putative colanic acid biosynthesis glycosyltransferase WcaI